VFEHPISYLKSLDFNSLSTRVPADLKLAGSYALKELKQDEGVYWNYSIAAPVFMSLLFFASTDLTEKISAGKYPYALSLYRPFSLSSLERIADDSKFAGEQVIQDLPETSLDVLPRLHDFQGIVVIRYG
jgi:hypothetical protein